MFLLLYFIDRFVLCWACSCHPWSCLSHELLVGKALYYRWTAYVFSSRAVLYIKYFFVSCFISVPCSWLLNFLNFLNLPSALDIRESHRLFSPRSHWSCPWVHPRWLMKMLTRAKPSGDSCGRMPGSLFFTFDMWGTVTVVSGSYQQCVFNHGWM